MTAPIPDWTLKPFNAHSLPARVAVGQGLTLGRASGNGLMLDGDAFPGVSAHHARLVLEGENLVVEDLGSTNGTFVNDQPVQRAVLRDGDVLRLSIAGPSFVVESRDGARSTAVVSPEQLARAARLELSQTSVLRIKRALGVPPDQDVGQVVDASARRARAERAAAACSSSDLRWRSASGPSRRSRP